MRCIASPPMPRQPGVRPTWAIGDGSRVGRGDLVDYTENGIQFPKTTRQRGEIVVIDSEWAWVQFPDLAEPCKYRLCDLVAASPPTFREFFADKHGFAYPGKGRGEPVDVYAERLAETFADYADLLAAHVTRRPPPSPKPQQRAEPTIGSGARVRLPPGMGGGSAGY